MKKHARAASNSLHVPMKRLIQSPIEAYFTLPEILPFFYPSKKSLEFPIFCKKARLFQPFYIDDSYLLCESLEKSLHSTKKPAGFFETLEKTLKSFEKTQLFHDIIQIKEKSINLEDFEADLQMFLVNLRIEERKANFQAFFNASFKIRNFVNFTEVLMFLKTEANFQKNPEGLGVLIEEGLKIMFRREILGVLQEKNSFSLDFLKHLASGSEKDLIGAIKNEKYDPHCEQTEYETFLQFSKRFEVNDFSRKLLFLVRNSENSFNEKGKDFLIEIKELLRTYDLLNIEDFLGNLLEIMRKSLPFCSLDFQKQLQVLIEDLKLSGTLDSEDRLDTVASQTSLLDASFCSHINKGIILNKTNYSSKS